MLALWSFVWGSAIYVSHLGVVYIKSSPELSKISGSVGWNVTTYGAPSTTRPSVELKVKVTISIHLRLSLVSSPWPPPSISSLVVPQGDEAISKTIAYTIACLGTFLLWRDQRHFCLHTEYCCPCQRDRAGMSSLEGHHSGRRSPVVLTKGILQSNAAYIHNDSVIESDIA